jgi:hypothetical protein
VMTAFARPLPGADAALSVIRVFGTGLPLN